MLPQLLYGIFGEFPKTRGCTQSKKRRPASSLSQFGSEATDNKRKFLIIVMFDHLAHTYRPSTNAFSALQHYFQHSASECSLLVVERVNINILVIKWDLKITPKDLV